MLNTIRPYAMPFAMFFGVIFYFFLSPFAFLTPYFIFAMLFFTYCDVSLKEIRFTTMHLKLILIQVLGSIVVYFLFSSINLVLAQALMICVLSPTATSAPVITRMLKGNVESLTAFSLLSNLSVAVVAPVFFSFSETKGSLYFLNSFFSISERFILILALPLFLALFIQKLYPGIRKRARLFSNFTFFLWVFSLTLLTAKVVSFISEQETGNYGLFVLIAVLVLPICVGQFLIGRKIGAKYNEAIAGGQGLGQKNTVLAIWMAQNYLNPLSSIGGAAYVLWQNVINSTQLWKRRKNLN